MIRIQSSVHQSKINIRSLKHMHVIIVHALKCNYITGYTNALRSINHQRLVNQKKSASAKRFEIYIGYDFYC